MGGRLSGRLTGRPGTRQFDLKFFKPSGLPWKPPVLAEQILKLPFDPSGHFGSKGRAVIREHRVEFGRGYDHGCPPSMENVVNSLIIRLSAFRRPA